MENFNQRERWAYIKNAHNYMVSTFGRIKIIYSKKYPNGKIKNPNDFPIDKDGYYRIHYKLDNGRNVSDVVHRVVAKTFIANLENKPVVNHIDSDRLNNNINNLEWCTQKENVYHSFLFGKRKENKIVPRKTKLTEYQISQIGFLRQYYSLKKISDLFNVSYTTMKNIVIKLKRLSHDNQQPNIYNGDYHENEGSTTIP